MADTIDQDLLILSHAPHLRSRQNVKTVMWLVVLALMPSTIYSVILNGFGVILLLGSGILSAVLAEAAMQLFLKKKITITDGSAVLTGLLLAMNVPPHAPWWIIAIGSAFSIIIVKQLFGGLGFNIVNPALAGRAFLMASWPAYMTTTWHEFSNGNILSSNLANSTALPAATFDAITGATPLGALKSAPYIIRDSNVTPQQVYDLILSNDMLRSLFIGNIGGVIGETSALLLIIGAIFLLSRKIITWQVPASFIGTVAIIMLVYYHSTGFIYPFRGVLFQLLSGGLILGAFFMATDMVTSPVTGRGMIIFGCGCGIITSVIRLWGGYPEGVSYSILLMNLTVPLIDRYTKPKVFGIKKAKKAVQ